MHTNNKVKLPEDGGNIKGHLGLFSVLFPNVTYANVLLSAEYGW